ncbi:MAG: TetR/AcrR family transcriptional regulator [Treponema sp.]|jgi:AcrR family transcriptional regulator|nr:TetR/AcrR family transcriptional regulator [Treponema sp.]
MKTDAIADSFIRLLKTNPYPKISVQMICDNAQISRNAFYYHFDNKEMLVQWICERDFMKQCFPYFKIKKGNISAESFFSYFLENKEFYNTIYSIDSGQLLRRCLEKAYLVGLTDENISKYAHPVYGNRRKVHPKIFRCYGCAGIAAVVLFWIRHEMKIPIKEIAEDLALMLTESLRDVRDNHLF